MVATDEITETMSREEYVYMAKLAEKSELYEEMSEFMRSMVTSLEPSSELTTEERKLVSASMKHEVGSLRTAWRIVVSIDRRDAAKGLKESALNRFYRARVEARLLGAVRSVLDLVDSHLLPHASENSKSRVFFLKMKGDYHRYLAEIQSGNDRDESAQETLTSYLAAQEVAEAEIPANDPIRLGLALNFSVFYHEILNEHDKACSLANKAFKDGIAESESESDSEVFDDQSNKESHMILGLLRDNLRNWTTSDL